MMRSDIKLFNMPVNKEEINVRWQSVRFNRIVTRLQKVGVCVSQAAAFSSILGLQDHGERLHHNNILASGLNPKKRRFWNSTTIDRTENRMTE